MLNRRGAARLPADRLATDLATGAAVVAALGVAALVQLIHGGVYFSQWAGDVFIPLEGVLHVLHGQWPHRDFMTPVGSLWYCINAIPALVMPLGASVLVWANLIVASLAAIATMAVVAEKLPRWLAALSAFYVGLVALSPRQIGESFRNISNNASYNRWCWALIAVVALAALLPGRSRRHDWRDAVVCALMIAACCYIKITYAVAGAGLVALAVMTTRGLAGWRFAGTTLLTAGLAIGLPAIVTGDLPGYLADMRTAVAVLPDAARTAELTYLLILSPPQIVLTLAVLVLARVRTTGPTWRFGAGQWAGILTLLCGMAISVQNHPEPDNPLLPIAMLIGWTATRDAEQQDWRYSDRSGQVILGLALALLMAVDGAAIGWTVIAPVDRSDDTRWLAQTHVPDLRVAQTTTGPQPANPALRFTDLQYFGRWHQAVDLVRPRIGTRRDAIVLPFTWSNPYPLLLGLPPVRHELAWWDARRTFNATHRPDPHHLLDHVDYVLVPHSAAYNDGDPVVAMWAAYGPTVEADFRRVRHTEHLDLWARKDCARRALC